MPIATSGTVEVVAITPRICQRRELLAFGASCEIQQAGRLILPSRTKLFVDSSAKDHSSSLTDLHICVDLGLLGRWDFSRIFFFPSPRSHPSISDSLSLLLTNKNCCPDHFVTTFTKILFLGLTSQNILRKIRLRLSEPGPSIDKVLCSNLSGGQTHLHPCPVGS